MQGQLDPSGQLLGQGSLQLYHGSEAKAVTLNSWMDWHQAPVSSNQRKCNNTKVQ
jgi:hypothetical protein